MILHEELDICKGVVLLLFHIFVGPGNAEKLRSEKAWDIIRYSGMKICERCCKVPGMKQVWIEKIGNSRKEWPCLRYRESKLPNWPGGVASGPLFAVEIVFSNPSSQSRYKVSSLGMTIQDQQTSIPCAVLPNIPITTTNKGLFHWWFWRVAMWKHEEMKWNMAKTKTSLLLWNKWGLVWKTPS